MKDEYTVESFDSTELNNALEDYEQKGHENSDVNPPNTVHWYLALRAAERFYAANARYPGSDDGSVAADVEELKTIAARFMKEHKANEEYHVDERCLQEICRSSNTEVCVIAKGRLN